MLASVCLHLAHPSSLAIYTLVLEFCSKLCIGRWFSLQCVQAPSANYNVTREWVSKETSLPSLTTFIKRQLLKLVITFVKKTSQTGQHSPHRKATVCVPRDFIDNTPNLITINSKPDTLDYSLLVQDWNANMSLRLQNSSLTGKCVNKHSADKYKTIAINKNVCTLASPHPNINSPSSPT